MTTEFRRLQRRRTPIIKDTAIRTTIAPPIKTESEIIDQLLKEDGIEEPLKLEDINEKEQLEPKEPNPGDDEEEDDSELSSSASNESEEELAKQTDVTPRKSTRVSRVTSRLNMAETVGDAKNGEAYKEVQRTPSELVSIETAGTVLPPSVMATSDADFDPKNPIIEDEKVHGDYENEGDAISTSHSEGAEDNEESIAMIEEENKQPFSELYKNYIDACEPACEPIATRYGDEFPIDKELQAMDISKEEYEALVFKWFISSKMCVTIKRWEERASIYDFMDRFMPGGQSKILTFIDKGYSLGQIRVSILATMYISSVVSILFYKMMPRTHKDDVLKFMKFDNSISASSDGLSYLFAKMIWYILLISISDLEFNEQETNPTSLLQILTMFHKSEEIYYHNKTNLLFHATKEPVEPESETGFYNHLDWSPILFGDTVECITVRLDKKLEVDVSSVPSFIDDYIKKSKDEIKSDLFYLTDSTDESGFYKSGVKYTECSQSHLLSTMTEDCGYVPVYFKFKSFGQPIKKEDVIFCNLIGWYCNCLDAANVMDELFTSESKYIMERKNDDSGSRNIHKNISKLLNDTFYSREWNTHYYFRLFESEFLIPLHNWYDFLESCYV